MRTPLLINTIGLGLLISLSINSRAQKESAFAIGAESFELNGKPYVICCGEMHFARIPKRRMEQRLQMVKAMGLNTVCAYLFGTCKKNSRSVYKGQKLFKNLLPLNAL